MYVRNENNKLKKYTIIPSKLKGITGNYAGGFHKLPTDIHMIEGFFPLTTPIINNPTLYKYGEIVMKNGYYEYSIVLKYPDLTLDIAKLNKLSELTVLVSARFDKNAWHYTRELRYDKLNKLDPTVGLYPVSDTIINEDANLYREYDRIKDEINNLNTIESVLDYEINIIKLIDSV